MSSKKTTEPLEIWVLDAMDLMIQERIPSLFQAANRLGLDKTVEVCTGIERRKTFREHYATLSRVFYASKGTAGDTDKNVIVGQILDDAQRLRVMGKPKEAAECTEKAAKILGLVGADTNISLFGDLSGSDLQRAVEDVRRRRQAEAESPKLPN